MHVSVVIPVYNAERYVEATVRSALLIAENHAAIGYRQRLRRQRWAAARSYLHTYAISTESRWLMGLSAVLFDPEGGGWTGE